MSLLWAVGQKITASRLNRRLPVFAYKPANTARSSTATSAADPDLVVALLAGVTYTIDGILLVLAASNTPDFRYSYAWTNTATVMHASHGLDPSVTSYSGSLDAFGYAVDTTTPSLDYSYGCGTNLTTIRLAGTVVVGSSADTTLTLQWAQSTSSADATTLYAGSYLKLTPAA